MCVFEREGNSEEEKKKKQLFGNCRVTGEAGGDHFQSVLVSVCFCFFCVHTFIRSEASERVGGKADPSVCVCVCVCVCPVDLLRWSDVSGPE